MKPLYKAFCYLSSRARFIALPALGLRDFMPQAKCDRQRSKFTDRWFSNALALSGLKHILTQSIHRANHSAFSQALRKIPIMQYRNVNYCSKISRLYISWSHAASSSYTEFKHHGSSYFDFVPVLSFSLRCGPLH